MEPGRIVRPDRPKNRSNSVDALGLPPRLIFRGNPETIRNFRRRPTAIIPENEPGDVRFISPDPGFHMKSVTIFHRHGLPAWANNVPPEQIYDKKVGFKDARTYELKHVTHIGPLRITLTDGQVTWRCKV